MLLLAARSDFGQVVQQADQRDNAEECQGVSVGDEWGGCDWVHARCNTGGGRWSREKRPAGKGWALGVVGCQSITTTRWAFCGYSLRRSGAIL